MSLRLAPILLALALIPFALPAASADEVVTCSSSTAVGSACIYHFPASGSLYCEKAWSSGGHTEQASATLTAIGSVWLSASYFCFNYSNYGENGYNTFGINEGVTLAGTQTAFGVSLYQSTYYPGSSPAYEAGCFAFYQVGTTWGTLPCARIPASWMPTVNSLAQSWASANFDCTSGSAPLIQLCARGPVSSVALVGASGCTSTGYARVVAWGNTVNSKEAGFASCTALNAALG